MCSYYWSKQWNLPREIFPDQEMRVCLTALKINVYSSILSGGFNSEEQRLRFDLG